MPPIVADGQLNLSSLVVDDIYVVILPPQTPLIPGFPTDGIGLVGTGARGPMNTPLPFSDPSSLVRTFGRANVATSDLVTEALGALKQGANNVWGVRVSDGTHVSATGLITDNAASPGTLITLTAASPGTWGNAITASVGVGSADTNIAATSGSTLVIGGTWAAADTVQVAVAPNGAAVIGTSATVLYTTVAGDTFASIATAIANKINSAAGTSKLVTASVTVGATTATVLLTANTRGAAGNSMTYIAARTSTASGTVAPTISTSLSGGTSGGTQSYRVVVQSDVDSAEIFDNITGAAGVGASSAALAIVNAINNGLSGIRGPSALVSAAVGAGSGTLLNQVVKLGVSPGVAGSDGLAGVTGATQIGVDGPVRTGMFALRGIDIAQFGLAGLTDSVTWTDQLAYAVSENLLAVVTMPKTITSTAAVDKKRTAGVDDYHMVAVKDFLYLNDTENKQIRLVSPIGAVLGRIAALSPERSPGNKPVFGYLGTERSGFQAPGGSFQPGPPYSYAEIALLESAGVTFITKPSVGGEYMSLRHGQNASSDPTRNSINYSKMTPFLAKSMLKALAFAVNEVHTPELRRRVKSALSQFLGSLAAPGPGRGPMIGDVNGGPAYSIVCDETNNPSNQVALGYLFVSVQVKYLSTVRFFVLTLEAGQSVTVKVQQSPVQPLRQVA